MAESDSKMDVAEGQLDKDQLVKDQVGNEKSRVRAEVYRLKAEKTQPKPGGFEPGHEPGGFEPGQESEIGELKGQSQEEKHVYEDEKYSFEDGLAQLGFSPDNVAENIEQVADEDEARIHDLRERARKELKGDPQQLRNRLFQIDMLVAAAFTKNISKKLLDGAVRPILKFLCTFWESGDARVSYREVLLEELRHLMNIFGYEFQCDDQKRYFANFARFLNPSTRGAMFVCLDIRDYQQIYFHHKSEWLPYRSARNIVLEEF